MDIDTRQELIAELVKERQNVRALALSEQFDVSLETIRKDLQALQDRGVLVRVHGGAQVRPIRQESAYERRRSVDLAAKQAIAEVAMCDVKNDSTIYLDYGTTTYALAVKLVEQDRRLTVLTNAMPIAQVLSRAEHIETVVLGGILRRNEKSLFGPLAERALEDLYMDAGFFGCAGVHAKAGITNPHPFEAAASHKAMTHCNAVVVLAAADKLDSVAAHRVAGLADIDTLITNASPGAELTQALDAADTTLVIAEEESDGLSRPPDVPEPEREGP